MEGDDFMFRKYYSKNNHLQPFFEEVNKYADGIHALNDAISLEDITSFQNELNIQIPDIYKDFLQMCNGGANQINIQIGRGANLMDYLEMVSVRPIN